MKIAGLMAASYVPIQWSVVQNFDPVCQATSAIENLAAHGLVLPGERRFRNFMVR